MKVSPEYSPKLSLYFPLNVESIHVYSEMTADTNCIFGYPYTCMDSKRGNPVPALGVGGNGLWKKKIVAYTLKWPSSLVCLVTCIN